MSIDFNSSENQSNFDLIPNNTLAKVRMSIKPGGFDDQNQGWSGGYATKNDSTGSVYLSCEFVILEGEYARRKVWGIIGLHSNKGPEWGNMGRSFIKAILNSSRGFCESDNSPAAQSARKINGIGDLDGMEFVAKITTKKDQNEELRNEIRFAITPDHKDYKTIMGAISTPSTVNTQSNPNIPAVNNRPAWAK
jgi:hypothetical protein